MNQISPGRTALRAMSMDEANMNMKRVPTSQLTKKAEIGARTWKARRLAGVALGKRGMVARLSNVPHVAGKTTICRQPVGQLRSRHRRRARAHLDEDEEADLEQSELLLDAVANRSMHLLPVVVGRELKVPSTREEGSGVAERDAQAAVERVIVDRHPAPVVGDRVQQRLDSGSGDRSSRLCDSCAVADEARLNSGRHLGDGAVRGREHPRASADGGRGERGAELEYSRSGEPECELRDGRDEREDGVEGRVGDRPNGSKGQSDQANGVRLREGMISARLSRRNLPDSPLRALGRD